MNPDELYLATPDRLAFALGWLLAAEIIGARYLPSAIDALPIFHPDHGWDRFLLTRRTTCQLRADEAADRFGILALWGEDAPRLLTASGETRLAVGAVLRKRPVEGLRQLLDLLPNPGLVAGDHRECQHAAAADYPDLVRLVSQLVAETPGLVVVREVYIDDQKVDGEYHPLYLHAVELQPTRVPGMPSLPVATTSYNWFQLQYRSHVCFLRIDGRRAIYRTDYGSWSRASEAFAGEPTPAKRTQLMRWLRVESESFDNSA